MTAPTEDLIERLEAAEAGSRELDYAIKAALEPMSEYWAMRVAADWTTSLDAALALAERVLPGCCVLVGDYKGLANYVRWNGKGEYRPTKGWASLSPDDDASSNYRVEAENPALALCIAILRARSALNTGSGEG